MLSTLHILSLGNMLIQLGSGPASNGLPQRPTRVSDFDNCERSTAPIDPWRFVLPKSKILSDVQSCTIHEGIGPEFKFGLL